MTFYDVPLRVETNPRENATDLLLSRVAKNPKHAFLVVRTLTEAGAM